MCLCVQIYLNGLTNYVPNAWNEENGCIICKEWLWQLPEEREKWPSVTLALFVEVPTPFLEDVLERIYKLDYPKEKMHLWMHNAVRPCSTRNILAINGQPK